MAHITDDQRQVVNDEKLVLEREMVRVNLDQVHYARTERRDLELEQLLADIRLKNRQNTTEFWKVGVLIVGVTAAIVQAANVIFGG